MEPDELERYMALKDRCTDIATEIYPHFKDMYPGGVKEMTALDPELSEEARASGISCCKDEHVNGENPTDRQQFWRFCIQETWHRGETVAPKKSLWTLLMKTKRTRAEKAGRPGRAAEAAVSTMRTVGRPRPPAAALRWMRTRPGGDPGTRGTVERVVELGS